jgi:hypothetical protein
MGETITMTISRFVEIFRRDPPPPPPITQVSLTKLKEEIVQALDAMEAEINRLEPYNVGGTALHRTLENLRTAYGIPRDPEPLTPERKAALEGLKQRALTARDEARQQIPPILTGLETHGRTAAAASAAIDKAEEAINQIPNEPAADGDKRGYFRELMDLRTRRDAHRTVRALREIHPFILELEGVETAAKQIVNDVAAATVRWQARAAKLAEIDKALGKLETLNQKVVDMKPVGDKLDALKTRRNFLNMVAPGQQLNTEVGALLQAISDAAAETKPYRDWGEMKPAREMIEGACNNYIVAAKSNKDLLKLNSDALLRHLADAEELAVLDPTLACNKFIREINPSYGRLKQQFFDEILRPPLRAESDGLATNPDSAEAQMKIALGSDAVYEDRMLEATNTAWAFGSPLAYRLSPGEAVAIYTYTGDDYQKMQGLLLGYQMPQTQAERGRIDIMIDQAKKVLAKLDNYGSWPTRRGDRDFIGADAQYKKDNEFTTKAFWSTGVGFSFSGKWQITIFGKTQTPSAGKEVKPLSNYPKEAEVLFPPGTKFRVIERDETEAPTTIYITVQEV